MTESDQTSIFQLKRTLVVAVTLIFSFLSLLAVIIFARSFGFDPSSFHNAERVLLPSTLLAALLILILPILIVLTAQRVLLNRSLSELRFAHPFFIPVLLGTLLGCLLKSSSTVGAFIATSDSSTAFALPTTTIAAAIPYFAWFIFSLFLNSLSEELVYRVFPVINLAPNSLKNSFVVILVTAVLFSLAHFLIESPNTLQFLYRLSFGLFAGLLFLRTRSLWWIVGLHTGWNIVAHLASDEDWRLGTLIRITGLSSSHEITANVIVLTISAVILLAWTPRSSRKVDIEP